MLFGAVTSAVAAHCICANGDMAFRLAEVLQPFAALGPKPEGAFMYDYCCAIAVRGCDEPAANRARWQALLQRLEGVRDTRADASGKRARRLDGSNMEAPPKRARSRR